MSNCNSKPKDRPTRPPVPRILLVSHPDGTLELYCDHRVDAHLVRVPVAHSRAAEAMAEDATELLTPHRFRWLLWNAEMRQLIASTRPLLPSVARLSLQAQDAIDALNGKDARRAKWSA